MCIRDRPQGDRCLIVSFGDQIDAAVGRTCLAAARKLRDAGLPGVTDVVPSFVAVAVHYRPDGLGNGPTYASLADRIETLLAEGIAADAAGGRDVDVPVCYGGEHGPDLLEVATAAGLTPDEVIALHSGRRGMSSWRCGGNSSRPSRKMRSSRRRWIGFSRC